MASIMAPGPAHPIKKEEAAFVCQEFVQPQKGPGSPCGYFGCVLQQPHAGLHVFPNATSARVRGTPDRLQMSEVVGSSIQHLEKRRRARATQPSKKLCADTLAADGGAYLCVLAAGHRGPHKIGVSATKRAHKPNSVWEPATEAKKQRLTVAPAGATPKPKPAATPKAKPVVNGNAKAKEARAVQDGNSVTKRMEALVAMHDKGWISASEFKTKKKSLLAEL
jgi:hypothetical protein